MNQNLKVQWPGFNGQHYEFTVCDIHTTFNPGYSGNYIFAKIYNNVWHAVYIGEGDLRDRTNCHRSEGKVTQLGATHIHYRVDNNEKSRCETETSLLAANPEAYHPRGCNVKIGG